MMRCQRIMRLRGVSGFLVITSGKVQKEHFQLNDDSFIKHKKDENSMLFMVEINRSEINPDQAMKTVEELSRTGQAAKQIGLAIERFMEAFADQLKTKFS